MRSSTDLTDSETEGALSLDGHTSLTAAARARRTNKILQLDALNVTNNYNSAEDASAQYCLISFSCVSLCLPSAHSAHSRRVTF